jgi:hypothetical protein
MSTIAALVSIQALSPELIAAGGWDETASAKLAEAKKVIIPGTRRALLSNLIGFAGDFARGKAGLTSPYLANPQQSLREIGPLAPLSQRMIWLLDYFLVR